MITMIKIIVLMSSMLNYNILIISLLYVRVVVAALNQIIGAVNFVIFSMPDGFKLRLIGEMPEINSFTSLNGIKWVTDGIGNYILSYENRGSFMEIHVSSSRKIKILDEKVELQDHEIFSKEGEFKISIFNPKTELRSALAIYCPITKRSIRITLHGKYSQEFINKITDIICH